MLNVLSGKKTYVLGAIGLLGIGARLYFGDITPGDAWEQAGPILMLLTTRMSISTAVKGR